MLVAGMQGSENDPGAYQMTPIFRDPDSYLLPHHTLLFDGVFQCKLHCKTDRTGMLPANANELRRANPAMRGMLKAMNRTQRYLRCPIEQTFGYIKGFDIVGESYFRGGWISKGRTCSYAHNCRRASCESATRTHEGRNGCTENRRSGRSVA
jgi:hypothetical protein